MARDFAGTDDYLSHSSILGLTDYPFAWFGWFNLANLTHRGHLISMTDNADGEGYGIFFDGTSSDTIAAGTTFTEEAAFTSAAVSAANTWVHVLGIFESDALTIRLNNANEGTSGNTQAFITAGTPRFTIGGIQVGTVEDDFVGRAAEIVCINKVPSEGEMAAHAAGMRAGNIWLPSNLVGWWPLWGLHSPEIDLSGNGRPLTISGTVNAYAPDPPIQTFRLGRRRSVSVILPAAAPVNITPPQGNLTLSQTAPSVVQTTSENEQPARVDLALSTTAPSVEIATYVNPAGVDLTLSTTAPTVDATTSENELPARVDLALSTTAPAIEIGIYVFPARGDLVLSGAAPAVDQTTSEDEQPARVDLALSTAAPTVSISVNLDISPARGDLALSTTAPTIAVQGWGCRDFNGSSQYLTNTSAPVSALPVTMGAWFFADSLTTNQVLMHLTAGSADSGYTIQLRGAVAGDLIGAFTVLTAVSGAQSDSLSAYTTSGWHAGVGVWNSTTHRLVYLDGVAGTASATSIDPGSINGIRIGARRTATHDSFLNGRIGEAFILNIEATAGEVAQFAAGVRPPNIWPAANIKGYWPIMGVDSPETDYSGNGNHLTLVAAPPFFALQPPLNIPDAYDDLVLSTTAPTVDSGSTADLSPARADLALSAAAPSVVQTTSEDETPAHDDLVLSGTAPAVDQTTAADISPARGDLVLSTTVPSVVVFDPSVPAGGDSFNPMLVSPGRMMNP